jgi:hypothetical protein
MTNLLDIIRLPNLIKTTFRRQELIVYKKFVIVMIRHRHKPSDAPHSIYRYLFLCSFFAFNLLSQRFSFFALVVSACLTCDNAHLLTRPAVCWIQGVRYIYTWMRTIFPVKHLPPPPVTCQSCRMCGLCSDSTITSKYETTCNIFSGRI